MISGTTYIHNAIEHDYCIEQCIASMADLCDDIVCLECDSTDGTADFLQGLCSRFPQLRVINTPWLPAPGGTWLSDLSNAAKSYCLNKYRIHIQGDEVLSEEAARVTRVAAGSMRGVKFRRLNFWLNPQTLTPEKRVCGAHVCRAAPVERLSLADDESLEWNGRDVETEAPIFHYGFIRKPAALAKKAIRMQDAWIGNHDPVLDLLTEHGLGVLERNSPLVECSRYEGPHPESMRPWLMERGHTI